MTPLDSQSLKRLHRLWLAARRARREPAEGIQCVGLRDYSPGDDYRHVDWTLCARRDELLTRRFQGDEDRRLSILLDCSPSMGLGRPSKFDVARQLAAGLGYVALNDQYRVAITAFSGRIVADLAPLWGKQQAPKLLRFLDRLQLDDRPTDLPGALGRFARRYQRPGPAVVISDLYDPAGFDAGLAALLGRGYQLRVIQLHEASEAEPRLLGDVELADVETGQVSEVTITSQALEEYRRLFVEFQQSVRRYCARWQVHCTQLSSETPIEGLLRTTLEICVR